MTSDETRIPVTPAWRQLTGVPGDPLKGTCRSPGNQRRGRRGIAFLDASSGVVAPHVAGTPLVPPAGP